MKYVVSGVFVVALEGELGAAVPAANREIPFSDLPVEHDVIVGCLRTRDKACQRPTREALKLRPYRQNKAPLLTSDWVL